MAVDQVRQNPTAPMESRPDLHDTGTPEDDELIRGIMECRREAYDARRTRIRLNMVNRDAFMNMQDWSHKAKGQSTEFLPKVALAAEQFTAFIKRALLKFGDWFRIELSQEVQPYITDGQARNLLKLFLERMPDFGNGLKWKNIETVLADGVKAGLLESLIIFKVYGRDMPYTRYKPTGGGPKLNPDNGAITNEPPSLDKDEQTRWHLCVDVVRTEDYYPDPTGRSLYEIHEIEKDYADVLEDARKGIYDLAVVEAMHNEDFKQEEFLRRREPQRGQDRAVPPSFRKRCVLTEFWGSIMDKEGNITHRNIVSTVANKKHLIRKPEENPYWHGESPFVVLPLIRVPHSVWHKALYDNASRLNFAMNEMFNLILDGGISAVWGIKQLRAGLLDDPRQVSDGIPQGTTLQVKDDLPEGQKVLETVSEGQVPGDAMAVFEMLNREFNASSLTNEIQMGQLPQRQVKATEVVQSNQSNAVTLDSISSDLEAGGMEPLLRKAFLTMMQHIDDIGRPEIVNAIGKRGAALLLMLPDAARFSTFANCFSVKAYGLSAVVNQAQDFQKLMAVWQSVSQNPMMMQVFLKSYSPVRLLNQLMKLLNINPDDIANTPDEQANLPQFLQQLQLFTQIVQGAGSGPAGQGSQDGQGGAGGSPAAPPQPGSGQGPGLSRPPGADPGMFGQINQNIQPTSGLQLAPR